MKAHKNSEEIFRYIIDKHKEANKGRVASILGLMDKDAYSAIYHNGSFINVVVLAMNTLIAVFEQVDRHEAKEMIEEVVQKLLNSIPAEIRRELESGYKDNDNSEMH